MGFVAHVLSDFRRGGHVKSLLQPYFLVLVNKTICYVENNQYPISLKAGSSIRPVQSLQLQQMAH